MIGHYQVQRCLGIGGMGEVYLVKDIVLGCQRALKTLKSAKSATSEQRGRFLREARIAAQVQHKAIVGVMEVVMEEQSPEKINYIVMEYVDGGSVSDLLKKQGKIEEMKALQIIRQAAEALQAAEKVKLVHRDIKPANIMFTKDGEVKLADFGIASSKSLDTEVSTTLTLDGSIMGTPAYASPEQCRDSHDVDVRSDIYSLGASLFEMVTGRVPYPGTNTCDIFLKVANDPIPDPRKLNPAISEPVADIIKHMIAKKPEDRPQTPKQLILELDLILNQSKITDEEQKKIIEQMIIERTTAQKKRASKQLSKKVRVLIAIAIFAVVLAAGIGSLFYFNIISSDVLKMFRLEKEPDVPILTLLERKLTLVTSMNKKKNELKSENQSRLSVQSQLNLEKSMITQDAEKIKTMTDDLNESRQRVSLLEQQIASMKTELDEINKKYPQVAMLENIDELKTAIKQEKIIEKKKKKTPAKQQKKP